MLNTKPVSLLWQQTMKSGGWIFVDVMPDTNTLDQLAFMTSLVGRSNDFYVLNVYDSDNSNTYSPIQNGEAEEVSRQLLNLLPFSENNPGADFYRQSTNHALTVLVGALKAAGVRYHFMDLAIMLQSPEAIAQVERMTPSGPAKMALQVFLDQFRQKESDTLDINRLKEALGGMAGRVAQFAQGQFGRVFNTYTPEIDLTDIIMNNKFLYVMLPTMGKDTAALSLGKMIVADVRKTLRHVQSLKQEADQAIHFLCAKSSRLDFKELIEHSDTTSEPAWTDIEPFSIPQDVLNVLEAHEFKLKKFQLMKHPVQLPETAKTLDFAKLLK